MFKYLALVYNIGSVCMLCSHEPTMKKVFWVGWHFGTLLWSFSHFIKLWVKQWEYIVPEIMKRWVMDLGELLPHTSYVVVVQPF